MFRADPSTRANLDQITSHPWLSGPRPTDVEIANEISRLDKIQNGKLLSWARQEGTKQLYVSTSQIYRDGDDGSIDVENEINQLQKEERKEAQYLPGFFEWTHFKADADGSYLLSHIVAIINKLKLDSNAQFDAKFKQDSTELVAEISQVKTDGDGGCSLINGQVTIYSEDNADAPKTKWAIFKRNEGDQFLFRSMFEAVVGHPEIQKVLLKKADEE